jgi:hypothetical protein
MRKRRDLTFGIQGLEAVKQAARGEVSKLFHRTKNSTSRKIAHLECMIFAKFYST